MVNRDITLDLGLTEGDLKFLSLLNTQSTLHENWITTEQLSQGPQLRDAEPAQLMDSDAYHNSPLTNWTPGTDDNAYMDQEYLSVPKHLDHPNPPGAAKPRAYSGRVSKESRDSAFAIVVKLCAQRKLNQVMQCFPSAELLDSLVENYLMQQRTHLDSWIHESTMGLNEACPELVMALAAAGAVLSPVEAIQKLGYALLEIARLHLNQKVCASGCPGSYLLTLTSVRRKEHCDATSAGASGVCFDFAHRTMERSQAEN